MTAGSGELVPQVFNVLRGRQPSAGQTPFGEVGTVFSGSGLELVRVSKQAEAATVFVAPVWARRSPRAAPASACPWQARAGTGWTRPITRGSGVCRVFADRRLGGTRTSLRKGRSAGR